MIGLCLMSETTTFARIVECFHAENRDAAKRAAREWLAASDEASEADLIVFARCLALVTAHPGTARQHLGYLWSCYACDEHAQELIASIATDLVVAAWQNAEDERIAAEAAAARTLYAARRAEEGQDRAPRGYVIDTDPERVPTPAAPQRHETPACVRGYEESGRAGKREHGGWPMTDDEIRAIEKAAREANTPEGYHHDHAERYSAPLGNTPCAACLLERPARDRASTDGMCTGCRDAGREPTYRAQAIGAHCAGIAERYGADAYCGTCRRTSSGQCRKCRTATEHVRTLLRTVWQHANPADRDTIAAWNAAHPIDPHT
jgi:hypothetical protein